MKSISPLVKVVRDGLRSEILQAPPGADYVIPSERQIGDRFGVSRTIVREALQALTREGLMRSQSRCRPVAQPPVRRQPTAGKSRHIGIWLWPFTEDFIVTSMLRGIQRSVSNADCRLIVGTASGARWEEILASEIAFIDSLVADEEAVGAVMWLLGDEQSLPALQRARARGIEFVFVDRMPPKEFEADFVGTDNVVSARAAVTHLIELGHQRIAFYRNSDTAHTVEERMEGYLRAMADHELEPVIIQNEHPDDVPETVACRRAMEALKNQKDQPTAIFAVNDSVALMIGSCLAELGLNVPEDISLVGFDGILRWVPGGGNLTSAHQNFSRIGELAAERLLSRTSGHLTSRSHRHVLLEAPLRIQSTTGRPRQSPYLAPLGPQSR